MEYKKHTVLSANAVREVMNEYGRYGIPFVFVIDYDLKQPMLFTSSALGRADILFNINGFKNYKKSKPLRKKVQFDHHPIPFEQYEKSFHLVQDHINAGNSYLLNLTFPSRIKTNLTLKEIFHLSKANYKLLFEDQFVVFSPEIFVKIKEGIISSFPMKGTIDANLPNAAKTILNDKKEKAEHYTIVDLIRNDLNQVASNVRVKKFRYIDLIQTNQKNLLQVSSEISGQLDENYPKYIGDILFKLLPAGSITGAPKPKTMEIIKSAEICPRRFYTGVFGYFDGKNLDSAVMIRYIENQNNNFLYKSGGGITTFSDAASEYQEMINKVYVPVAH